MSPAHQLGPHTHGCRHCHTAFACLSVDDGYCATQCPRCAALDALRIATFDQWWAAQTTWPFIRQQCSREAAFYVWREAWWSAKKGEV
jgi:hypothetical protein